MRLRYKYNLISFVKKWIDENHPSKSKEFKFLSRRLTAKYQKGFYVYGPQLKNHQIKDYVGLAKYVARYASHPPISEGRIENFDKERKTVTWYYDPHEDDTCEEKDKKGRQHIADKVEDFISKLIIHIPTKKFQQIRYYGFYANKTKNKSTAHKLCSRKDINEMRALLRWENMLIQNYGYSPLICDCGARMKINHSLSYYPGMEFTTWIKSNSS